MIRLEDRNNERMTEESIYFNFNIRADREISRRMYLQKKKRVKEIIFPLMKNKG